MVISARIRALLAQAADGLTSKELAAKLNVERSQISHSVKGMPDVYVDRWQKTTRRYAAVHCLAFVPDDCPHP